MEILFLCDSSRIEERDGSCIITNVDKKRKTGYGNFCSSVILPLRIEEHGGSCIIESRTTTIYEGGTN